MYAVEKIYDFACETPDAVAMVCDLEPISYRALHQMTTAMRKAFVARGVTPAGVAVVQIESIKVSWIVDMALRSLGLTTVAINSPAELEALAGLDVTLVVTSGEEARDGVPSTSFPAAPRIGVTSGDWRVDADAPFEPPPPVVQTGHILFTSGTTGLRKKILVDAQHSLGHAGSLGLYRSHAGFMQREWRDMMINLLNFGLWTGGGYVSPALLWSLGGAVITHQGPAVERSFAVPGITHALVTPTLLEQLLAASPEVLPRNDDLQLLVVGGALSLPLANRTKARLTNRVATTLGSTEGGGLAMTPIETAVDLRWHRLDPKRLIEVVDENHRPLPPGQLGQVRVLQEVGGPLSYIDDPIATATFFRDGYFYPGDLGVLDGQGRLMLSGRVTDILNVKGDKIPSGPIEAELQAALDLHGVCVLSELAADGTDQMHIVLETDAVIDPNWLEEVAKPYLAYFPTVTFHTVHAFPRNGMGKVERLKLRQVLVEQGRARAAE